MTDSQNTCGCVSGNRDKIRQGQVIKGRGEETFWYDGCGHYLYCSDGFWASHVLRVIKLCVKYMRVTVYQLYLNKIVLKRGKHTLISRMTSQASRSSVWPSVPHMQRFQCFLQMLVHTGVFLNHSYVDISFPKLDCAKIFFSDLICFGAWWDFSFFEGFLPFLSFKLTNRNSVYGIKHDVLEWPVLWGS